jgi:hypothetical protein
VQDRALASCGGGVVGKRAFSSGVHFLVIHVSCVIGF